MHTVHRTRQPIGPWALLAACLSIAPQGIARADDTVVEQMIVTATRVVEDGQRLPLAWSSVGSDDLAITQAVHVNEIMQRVPGAWISRNNGQESLVALRSPVLTGPGSCGAFYTAADGISLRAPGFCNVNQLFDANVEQAGGIEVIKGPATALFGSNAMHGVINVLSAAPATELDHSIALEAGPYDYYRGKYRYSNTHGAHGISININGVSDGGYKDDSGYDQQKVTLRHDYQGQRWSLRTVLDGANLEQETAAFLQEGFEAYKRSELKKINDKPQAYRDAWSWRLYSRLDMALDEQTSVTITPYVRDNEMEFLQHFLPWEPVEENAHTSFGLRAALHSELPQWRWVSGVDLEYTDATLYEFQEEPFSERQPQGVHYDYQVDATLAALYSQVRSQWDSPWELGAGVRFEHTNYDYDNRTGDGPACAPGAEACRFFRPADREDDFNNWSLNAGASYSFNPDLVAYLRLARGFRAPQATELYRLQEGQATADLDAEEIDNIEIGLRGSLAQRGRFTLSVYYMEKDQVIFQDADRQNISGAQTEHYGAELSLDIALGGGWSLGVDASAASHTYASAINLLGASGDIEGNDIDTAPQLFGSARLGRDLSALTGRDGSAELEWVYLDEYYLEPDNEHRYEGHSLFNARVSSALSPRWSAALRVTNLLDVDYAERADFGFGNYRYFVGQPRGVYATVTHHFR
ncbi:MAG: TonB-dependent receptor [Halioglobus sp.]|nr:TonB-dependent receptor [Halioglobus sp.]